MTAATKRTTVNDPAVIEHDGVQARKMAITPELAQHWLDTANTHNRPINGHNLRRYTVEMSEGRWHPLLGEPIALAEDGTLLNGQHRLLAVVNSGTTQVFLVLGGLPQVTQDAMDAGALRKAGQQFGLRGWKNGTTVAAAARLLLQWERKAVLSDVYRPSTEELTAFGDTHRTDLVEAVAIGLRVRRSVPLLAPVTSAVAFASFELAAANPHRLTLNEAHGFFEALETGANLDKGHPILTLRATATRRRANQVRTSTPRELFAVVRTWNAWRRNESLDKIQLPKGGALTDEHFEMI